jgi:hypothetical protein
VIGATFAAMLRRCLARSYPRGWRERYGEEFAALLAETPLTVHVVLDVLRAGALAHVRARSSLVRAIAAVAWTGVALALAMRTGVTANLLWPPSDPLRAVALAITFAPSAAVVAHRPSAAIT